MRLVQLQQNDVRRVGIVDGSKLKLLQDTDSVYALASRARQAGRRLISAAEQTVGSEVLDYDSIYEGKSEWRLLPPIDHPEPARCLVSGTGLTHKASVDNRSAMHKQATAELTDSMRMYQLGLEGGNPAEGEIGVQPEWFYKGTGAILRAHNEELAVPTYAEDGGEEPEIAGAYLIGPDGVPLRIGFTVANEFSDHKMEKRNYLYLAPSKLRNCAIGPELTIGDVSFASVPGTVQITRAGEPIWSKPIETGQNKMCHSLRNLEHHQFKYEAHRRPGDVHVHFLGADAFSFGAGIQLQDGDWMEVSFPQFGRPLRNRLSVAHAPDRLIAVASL